MGWNGMEDSKSLKKIQCKWTQNTPRRQQTRDPEHPWTLTKGNTGAPQDPNKQRDAQMDPNQAVL